MIINAEQTAIDSYNLIYTGDGTDTEPVAFPLGVTTGTIDLLKPIYGGRGGESKSYRLAFLFTGTPAGTGTIVITGANEGGPEEYICSLAVTIGATVETGAWRWVDIIDVTSYHLAACSILSADSGNGRPCKLGFDAIGYRYIKIYSTALVTTTSIKVYARYF